MHRLLNKKLYTAFSVFFILCVCACAFSSVQGGMFITPSVGGQDSQPLNSLSNASMPKAYFLPDRSEYSLIDKREFVPVSLFVVLIFSIILFVSFIYCTYCADRRACQTVVLLI